MAVLFNERGSKHSSDLAVTMTLGVGSPNTMRDPIPPQDCMQIPRCKAEFACITMTHLAIRKQRCYNNVIL
jgi:hypothetical protein